MSEGSSFASISFGYDADAVFKYRDENMCSKWKNTFEKDFLMCKVKASANQNGNYIVSGNTKNFLNQFSTIQPIFIQYWAPNKPHRGYSFNGSGLPFPNEEIAFEDTMNKGVLKVSDGVFNFKLDYPNSYYSQMGRKLNPPCVKFRFCDSNGKTMSKIYTMELGHVIPYRSLNFPKKRDWNDGPLFYQNNELKNLKECRNQFQILVDSQYPGENGREAANFWGLKPPM